MKFAAMIGLVLICFDQIFWAIWSVVGVTFIVFAIIFLGNRELPKQYQKKFKGLVGEMLIAIIPAILLTGGCVAILFEMMVLAFWLLFLGAMSSFSVDVYISEAA